MRHYLSGDTAIEAYWKSVVWPGQGVFIGEPLARPYAPVGKDASASPAQ
jgi:xylose isomerase